MDDPIRTPYCRKFRSLDGTNDTIQVPLLASDSSNPSTTRTSCGKLSRPHLKASSHAHTPCRHISCLYSQGRP